MLDTESKIIQYLQEKILASETYKECVNAKHKYLHETYYLYTDNDYDNFIMLASAWSAIIRRAYRLSVIDCNVDTSSFWNAFTIVFINRQKVLLDNSKWVNLKEYHKPLIQRIEKSHNPQFMKRMFTGLNWDWLNKELKRQYQQ